MDRRRLTLKHPRLQLRQRNIRLSNLRPNSRKLLAQLGCNGMHGIERREGQRLVLLDILERGRRERRRLDGGVVRRAALERAVEAREVVPDVREEAGEGVGHALRRLGSGGSGGGGGGARWRRVLLDGRGGRWRRRLGLGGLGRSSRLRGGLLAEQRLRAERRRRRRSGSRGSRGRRLAKERLGAKRTSGLSRRRRQGRLRLGRGLG